MVELLGGSTFSIAGGGLDAAFDSERFEDPFCGFLRLITTREFAFSFLECLSFLSVTG